MDKKSFETVLDEIRKVITPDSLSDSEVQIITFYLSELVCRWQKVRVLVWIFQRWKPTWIYFTIEIETKLQNAKLETMAPMLKTALQVLAK
jgi:hypothetical protein